MEGKEIVRLYWDRNERAIKETSVKYGDYCYQIAFNILLNKEDADESVNDTWLDKDTVIIHVTSKDSYYVQDYYVYDIQGAKAQSSKISPQKSW